jgi:hypothetical protein
MYECVCVCMHVQSVPFKNQPNNNHVLRYTKSEAGPPRVIHTLTLSHDTRVKVALVARPGLTKKLFRSEHGVFTSRTCVHSRILLRIEIICCCS